jgi:hypothetical protein
MKPTPLLSTVAAIPAPPIITRRERTFSDDLTLEDRRRLRAIVIKTHRFLFAADPSTRHVDQVIDSLGPQVARQMVLRAMASGKID